MVLVLLGLVLSLQLASPTIATWPAAVDLRCVQGDSSDWSTRAVIVPAVFKEWAGSVVPAWLLADGHHTVYRYQRLSSSTPCYCANAGFEAGVYLTFIASHERRPEAAHS